MLLQTLFINFYAYWWYFRHYLWNFVFTDVTSDIIYVLHAYRCYFRHYVWTDVTSDIIYELCLLMLLQTLCINFCAYWCYFRHYVWTDVSSDIIYELLCLPMLLQTLFMNFYAYWCYFRHYLRGLIIDFWMAYFLCEYNEEKERGLLET